MAKRDAASEPEAVEPEAVDKAARIAPAVAEAAARVPTFGHIAYHPDRYSPAGSRKARGHGAGARTRKAPADA